MQQTIHLACWLALAAVAFAFAVAWWVVRHARPLPPRPAPGVVIRFEDLREIDDD